MRRIHLLCAIAASLWSSLAAAGQSTDGGAMSGALRAHVQDERFQIVTSIRGLPLGVRDGLQMLFGSPGLDIADPGAEFQAAGATSPHMPTRRLVVAGCSSDHHCLVYYERGVDHTWRAALFHWTPTLTRFEGGGTAPGGLATIDDVRRAILAGGFRASVW